MSCLIVVSENPEQDWIIKNIIYEWFVNLIIDQNRDDVELAECLRVSVYIHGLFLHKLNKESPVLASRVVEQLREVAQIISDGQYVPIDEKGEFLSDNMDSLFSKFQELVILLNKIDLA